MGEYSEEADVHELVSELESRYSHDTRNMYRIIDWLVTELTESKRFSHHYNKYTVIMKSLEKFYIKIPYGHQIVYSYRAYVANALHEKKEKEKERREEERRDRKSCRCVLL